MKGSMDSAEIHFLLPFQKMTLYLQVGKDTSGILSFANHYTHLLY